MTRDQPSAGNLTGSLLVAHPSLRDANFRRTIILLSHHSAEDGAVGIVLNRPAGQSISDLSTEIVPSFLATVPVFTGGPVSDADLLLASIEWDLASSSVIFQTFGDPAEAEEIPSRTRPALRAFLGYSGWSRGQLEAEIAQTGWLIVPPTQSLIAAHNTDDAWRTLMRSISPVHHLLAEMPDDPSLN
jgi:putative transcriptional regulator